MDATDIPSFYQYLSTMGIGGILAGFAIWMLNKTWKDHTQVIIGFHEIEKGRAEMLVKVVMDNTTATTRNNVVLDALHRRLDKDAYDRENEKS